MHKPPLQDVIMKNDTASPRRGMGGDTVVRGDHEVRVMRPTFMGQQRPLGTRQHGAQQREVRDDGEREILDRGDPFSRNPGERTGRTRGNRGWLVAALVAGGAIVATSVVLSLLFSGATVIVYPAEQTVAIDTSLLVARDAGDVTFEMKEFEKRAQEEVVAVNTSDVQERAGGKITIYNEYSSTPQRLLKRTRFASADGHIFRIPESVEVPGKKDDGTPGSIEVTVQAEDVGDAYNVGPGDFSIPGFYHKPQDKKIYGRSTDAMKGGFVGKKRVIDDAARAEAGRKIEEQLKNDLLNEVYSDGQIPEGYHVFKDALFFEYASLPDESSVDDKVVLSMSGKVHVVLLSTASFTAALAGKVIPGYTGTPYRIDNIADLKVTLVASSTVGDTATSAPWNAEQFIASVSGQAKFVGEFDTSGLKKALVGIDKEMLGTDPQSDIYTSFPGIQKMTARTRPFWSSTLPKNEGDIEVTVATLDSNDSL